VKGEKRKDLFLVPRTLFLVSRIPLLAMYQTSYDFIAVESNPAIKKVTSAGLFTSSGYRTA